MSMSGEGAVAAYPLFQREGGGSIPTSPLQLTIYEIPIEKAIELNKLWHSRLPIIIKSNIIRNKRYVCYGAFNDGKYYAVGIWSSPVARLLDDRTILELRRMAICQEAPKNTASRMLKIMTLMIKKKWPEIVKLISYQDTAIHKGTIYKAHGWEAKGFRKGGEYAWSCNVRQRAKCQAPGDKIRWEKIL